VVNKKEYIYICDKCQNEIIPFYGTIQCDNCGNKMLIKDTDWSNKSLKKTLNKSNFLHRFYVNVSNRFELLSNRKKIIITTLIAVFFLILPVEIYDLINGAGFFAGALICLFCFLHIKFGKYRIFNSTLVNVLVFFALIFANGYSYYYRRDRLLNQNGRTVEAQITEFSSSLGKHIRIRYVHYKFTLDGNSYSGKENISKSDYFQLNDKKTLLIDYVDYRPWISRINKKSLGDANEFEIENR
jgi:DNA-directed RNA polymerase subunit RPC12/RpoP